MWVKVTQSQCSRTPQRWQMPHALYLSAASLLSLSAMRKASFPLFCVELLGGNASFSQRACVCVCVCVWFCQVTEPIHTSFEYIQIKMTH